MDDRENLIMINEYVIPELDQDSFFIVNKELVPTGWEKSEMKKDLDKILNKKEGGS
jgi:hypothetical protein